MEDEQLLRYSRHILLSEIDVEGQSRLVESSALIVGLGGLGSPIAMYLAASGIGRLVLVDDDRVELSNLQRQIVHSSADLGRPKVESARDRLLALNPEITVETIPHRLDENSFAALLPNIDVVLDATDNFTTRFLINEQCFRFQKPLVSGAAIRFEGQVSVYHPGRADSPCYRCLYSNHSATDQTCTANGVIAPLLGIIGSVQALEAIKVLTGAGQDLCGRLLLLDALTMEWQTMRFRRDPHCPVCTAGVEQRTVEPAA